MLIHKGFGFMNRIQHIQYPVGQGGLHLGIVGDVAYIYDCGGKPPKNYWKSIFCEVQTLLSSCKSLHIFISHLHADHCNKLFEFLNLSAVQKITDKQIYMPAMCLEEQIMLLTEYDGDDYERYYNLVVSPENALDNVKINQIAKGQEKEIRLDNYILYPYVTKLMMGSIQKFRKELANKNLCADTLITDLSQDGNLLKQVKQIFINTFSQNGSTKYITNRCMLCLYAGSSAITHTQDYWHDIKWTNYNNVCRNCYLEHLLIEESYKCPCDVAWLHTGDIDLSTDTNLDALVKHYGLLLYNVRVAQIPHHGSANNHNCNFSKAFQCDGKKTLFFYTYHEGCVVLKVSDIDVHPGAIHCVSDNNNTKIRGIL